FSLTWREGKWYLSALLAEHRELLGREVISVAGKPVPQAAEAFGGLLSADNPVKLRRQFRQACNVADLYEYLGMVETGEPLVLTLAEGTELSLTPVSMEELGKIEIAQLGEGLPQPATAAQDCYYCAFPLNSDTYYIQYNACAEDPELPMEQFAAQAAEELGNYRRVVVDLRNNGGGSDGVLWPLLEVLRREMDQGAELVGLIGETTFSSAIINAVELQEMGGVLVGEPASGSVDHFGSVGSFRLPNSGLRVGVSQKYIDLDTLFDAGAGRGVEALEPDVTVLRTMEDTLAGRDTAVEWLLAHPDRLEQQDYPDAPLTRGRFAALLWQKAGSPQGTEAGFADTFGIEWFLPALSWAAERGILSGVGGGAVQAARPVTRQEAAVMLTQYAGLTGADAQSWTDWEKIAPWAREAVAAVAAAGLMNVENGAFRPLETLTRAEGESIISMLD
ncbi:MAG: hypothetical protein HFF57_09335, partial [Lawsonibacter sp.]|nr:hypothetical protein [Lawsonibacter sp.]